MGGGGAGERARRLSPARRAPVRCAASCAGWPRTRHAALNVGGAIQGVKDHTVLAPGWVGGWVVAGGGGGVSGVRTQATRQPPPPPPPPPRAPGGGGGGGGARSNAARAILAPTHPHLPTHPPLASLATMSSFFWSSPCTLEAPARPSSPASPACTKQGAQWRVGWSTPCAHAPPPPSAPHPSDLGADKLAAHADGVEQHGEVPPRILVRVLLRQDVG